jgi:transcriptional regulator with XRE-family HTH domain
MRGSRMKKPFAQLLEHHIAASGIKQVHLAREAGISYNYLARLMAGTRNPSDQVVYRLSQALRFSREQTAELLSAAGFVPPMALLAGIDQEHEPAMIPSSTASIGTESQVNRLIQQFYRLAQEIPEQLQHSFLEEMRCLLGYARFKYMLSGGVPLLDIDMSRSTTVLPNGHDGSHEQTHLDAIAQIIGELSGVPAEELLSTEDTLSTLDQLLGNLLTGKVTATNYHPHLVAHTLDILTQGAPWEIRRRIAEALPSLCRLDVTGAMHLIEVMRVDLDEVRGPDIRRRVMEALPAAFETAPQSLPAIIRLLQPRPGDDIYVALATVETCGDLQVQARFILEQREPALAPDVAESIRRVLPEVATVQRQIVIGWDGAERESLQFSMALHNLLPAPDTLLISLQEGLQSQERLLQLVAVRYLERVLPVRPTEALQVYLSLPRIALHKNVRRTVAKALPALLQCLKEASLSTRALARSVILQLAADADIPIRRAVADHAMQVFSIDREFLLTLLKQMGRDSDSAIRYRLRPVALRLAEVWLSWYAETAGLVTLAKRGQTQVIQQPFGE